MKKKKWDLQNLISLGMILVGNCIFVAAVKLFVMPSQLISTGTTGIAFAVSNFTGFSMSAFILLFNVAMLAVGWMILGRKFAMSTIFSSLFYPVALEVLNRVLGDVQVTENMLLNVIFAGMGLALGLGLVIRGGASTGGMDIPPLVLNKLFRVPVPVSLWISDFCILLMQMAFHPVEDLLYGIVLLVVISTTLNKTLVFGAGKAEVKIISEKALQIRDGILSKVDRGCTLLHGESGYRRRDTEVILTIVSNSEVAKIERLARGIDPNCFIIVNSASEVWGRGFTYGKLQEPEK